MEEADSHDNKASRTTLARTIHTQDNNTMNNATNESGDSTAKSDRMIIDGKSTQHYDDTTNMVELWREELYMMNVKNSILLDDLVKLGADA